ncbi:hypothetical protein QMM04_19070, partial [Pantoea sp. Pa-EAmG]|nr:hypothetical protein [Pantoea sp. Pa-EAmG]
MQSIIHSDIDVNEDDCGKLRQIIQGNILKIAQDLAGDLQWYSQNAQLVPDSVTIISIQPVGHKRFKMLY